MKTVARWQKWLALALFVGCVVSVIVWHGRFTSDFWPPDRSFVGPNLVASVVQWALILMVVALLYPPLRLAIDRYVKRHVADLKAHVSAEHAKVHAKLDHNAKLMAHIVKHHPDIPNVDHNGVDLTKEHP